MDEWRTVFTLGAFILFISSLFYIVFGSAEVQSWNEPKNENGKTLNIMYILQFFFSQLFLPTYIIILKTKNLIKNIFIIKFTFIIYLVPLDNDNY